MKNTFYLNKYTVSRLQYFIFSQSHFPPPSPPLPFILFIPAITLSHPIFNKKIFFFHRQWLQGIKTASRWTFLSGIIYIELFICQHPFKRWIVCWRFSMSECFSSNLNICDIFSYAFLLFFLLENFSFPLATVVFLSVDILLCKHWSVID